MTSPRNLIRVLSDPSHPEWESTVAELGCLTRDSKFPVAPLIEGLNSSVQDVVFNCAIGLERLEKKAKSAIPKLIHIISASPWPSARCGAIRAIVKIDPEDKRVKEAILGCLGDADFEVRAETVGAAVKMRHLLDSGDIEKIHRLQDDPESWVRDAADAALRILVPPSVAGRPVEIRLPDRIRITELADLLVAPPMQLWVWLVSMGHHIEISGSIDFHLAAELCSRCGVVPLKE